MLSGVLNSDRAVQVNIAIMRTFVRLRQAFTTAPDMPTRIHNAEAAIAAHDLALTEHAVQFHQVFIEIGRLKKP